MNKADESNSSISNENLHSKKQRTSNQSSSSSKSSSTNDHRRGIFPTQGCCTYTGLCCFQVKNQSQIRILEHQIISRQKKFGIEYLDLVERKASQQQLKQCLQQTMKEIAEIQGEINYHYDQMEGKQNQVKEQTNEEKKNKTNGKESERCTSGEGNDRPLIGNTENSLPSERPLFTIDSDDEDDYGGSQQQQRQQKTRTVKKDTSKERNKKKEKK